MTVIKRRYNGTWRTLGAGGTQTVPMEPTGVAAVSPASGSVTISWTPPIDNGGSPLTGYVVTYTHVSNGMIGTTSTGSGATSATVNGLIVGDLYGFTVHATNAIGASAESQPAAQVVVSVAATLTLPTSATVGMRYAPTRTITAAQALVELRSTGTLSRAIVQGQFNLSGSDGVNWVIEDVRFEGGGYTIRGYSGQTAFAGTQTQRPIFRHVELIGAGALRASDSSAVIYGQNMIFEYADIYGGIDGVKASANLEMRYSWVHDLDHPDATHCDGVQIVSGTNIVFIGNRFDAYIGYVSDGSSAPTGDTGSGMLQTGSVTNNISALWENNWFAGGHYTIRGANADVRVDYTFRNNRFLRYGTSVALGLTDLPPNRFGPIYGGVSTNEIWENNVWDDTEAAVS